MQQVIFAATIILATACIARPARADDTSPAGGQQEKSFEKEITVKVKLNYLLFLPQGYEKSDKPWPMILFLHGAGESGNDLSKVKRHGPPKIVETKKDFPFIVVSPQSSGRGWNPDTLNGLLTDVLANYRVDKDRVYLTGLSMGGAIRVLARQVPGTPIRPRKKNDGGPAS